MSILCSIWIQNLKATSSTATNKHALIQWNSQCQSDTYFFFGTINSEFVALPTSECSPRYPRHLPHPICRIPKTFESPPQWSHRRHSCHRRRVLRPGRRRVHPPCAHLLRHRPRSLVAMAVSAEVKWNRNGLITRNHPVPFRISVSSRYDSFRVLFTLSLTMNFVRAALLPIN